ncbi:tryptophan synthase beta chain 2, partial [Tanacetum coccineum]
VIAKHQSPLNLPGPGRKILKMVPSSTSSLGFAVFEAAEMETLNEDTMYWAINFARSKGIISAPEPTHAIATTIREANCCKESGESEVILDDEGMYFHKPPQFSKLLL